MVTTCMTVTVIMMTMLKLKGKENDKNYSNNNSSILNERRKSRYDISSINTKNLLIKTE